MAAFEWPLGKLELINSALSQTGDDLVSAADDGSEEWKAASPAYERGLAYISENHNWMWLTGFRTLQPSPTAPADTNYDTAFPLPADLVHIILVQVNGAAVPWDLQDNQIVVNAAGGTATIKGIFSTNSEPTFATPTVVLVLQMFVMSGIYRGLHSDTAEADKLWAAALSMLREARSRHDMQKPKRAPFLFRSTAARRARRPLPSVISARDPSS